MKIGLFFGSFNPPHLSHAIVAINAQEQFKLDKVWFVVSPHNPFKKEKGLLAVDERMRMVDYLCNNIDPKKFKVSNVEMFLSLPSYTSQTLRCLEEEQVQQKKINKHIKKNTYYIIMGSDCLSQINKWKDYKYILENFTILNYPRLGYDVGLTLEAVKNCDKYSVKYIKAPLMEISSTEIREKIKRGKSIQFLVPSSVCDYIIKYELYK